MTERPLSLLNNLAKKEAATPERKGGKLSFSSALKTLNIRSVFDIVRRSKTAFVRELSPISDADAALAYENARPQQLEGSAEEAARINLDDRRPDLKDLLIDQQSTFTPIPTLHFINQVLSTAINAYVDTVPTNKGKSLYQLESEKQFPPQFPYNVHFQQISLGLAGKKPKLGELSYRVSLEVPATSSSTAAYGKVQHSSANAQLLMAIGSR
ncbi:Tc toxin subunit A [Pseudomonas syringae]|uniref:Tc toxin subunit A n=1 Tax=Pseudomonas syringae TaxID=317 RepID=UPI003F7554DB